MNGWLWIIVGGVVLFAALVGFSAVVVGGRADDEREATRWP